MGARGWVCAVSGGLQSPICLPSSLDRTPELLGFLDVVCPGKDKLVRAALFTFEGRALKLPFLVILFCCS